MILGIDASNIRIGGGLTHLSRLLHAADPLKSGVERVVVWANRRTIEQLPSGYQWLERAHEPLLDRSLPFRLFWRHVKLDRLARSAACDLLYVPGGSYRGRFTPVVTMSRNMLPFEPAERQRYGVASWMFFRLLLLERVQLASFHRANGTIFLSEYARATINGRGGSFHGLSVVIPHGVDDRFFLRPRPQRPLSACSPAHPFKLLYVSIIDVYKHQWAVAEAVSKLRGRGVPVVLELIGPAYRPALARLEMARQRLDPDGNFICYRGAIPYDRLPSAYHNADAFVFASTCENLPNILLEAMASGLPIACSNRGPMPEILGDAGMYFDPENVDSVAEALGHLLEDVALREACARAAYARAQQYSWERCARETFEFLAQTAETFYQQKSVLPASPVEAT